MNLTKSPKSMWFCFLLILFSALNAEAQESGNKSFNYGFLSPNTRDDLKLNDAIKGMNSTDEVKLMDQARNLGCVVRTRIRTFRALGSWSDGAEHSVMLRLRSREDSLRYVLSRMGRDFKQKAVLYFHPQANGTALIYRLEPRSRTQNLKRLTDTLEKSGIEFRTLVPTKNNTWVFLVDLKNELRENVRVAAKRLRAKITVEKGVASFVGADQADQAKDIFTQHIKEFEAKYPDLPATCDVRRRPR
jgi:hypothetical protein